jgi:arabinogalactan oligomer/maltooligosaccharide transport system permease protein
MIFVKWFASKGWRHAIAWAVCFFALFPLYMIVLTSFKKTTTLQVGSFLPTGFTLVNFDSLLNNPTIPFYTWMSNSVVISLFVAVVSVFVGAASAFAFSRLRFKGKKGSIQLLLLIQMFPSVLALSAVYSIMERVQLFAPGFGLGTIGGLILVYLGGAMGVNIWLLKGFVDSIPIELDEAARVDGASPMQIYWRIFFPLASPVLAVVCLLTFIGTFNEYILAALFLTDPSQQTVAVGLRAFIGGQFESNWGPFAAGSLLTSLPIVILFLSLQKYIINGLTAGAVKG